MMTISIIFLLIKSLNANIKINFNKRIMFAEDAEPRKLIKKYKKIVTFYTNF